MEQLSARTSLDERQIGASAPDETGIVHLGLGAFHRAHAAVHTAEALAIEPGPWGIVGFANRSDRVVAPMQAQGHRYAVLELSAEGERAGIVDVHRRSGVVAANPGAFLAAVADPAHRIVTLTISETGYSRSARTGRLDLDLPEIRADLANPAHPRSAVGLLARGLIERARHAEPVTVLSCDNLQSNGDAARDVVRDYLEASNAPADVLTYVDAQVTFPNSMVDRIVPATTPETSDTVARLLGIRDDAAVRAESFSMWVLEDRFAAGRPAWDRAGAIMSDEVEAYEIVKLRLLNGSHSLIAYLGALDGRETIVDAFRQPFVRDAVLSLIHDDHLPSIAVPDGLDVDAYIESLEQRWANAPLGDRTSRVGSDGSTKLPQRLPEATRSALAAGRMPHQLALTVAAWIACVVPVGGFDPGPIAAEMHEPARERLRAATASTTTVRDHVRVVLDAGVLPDMLAADSDLVDRVAALLDTIVRRGVRAAAHDALDAQKGAAL